MFKTPVCTWRDRWLLSIILQLGSQVHSVCVWEGFTYKHENEAASLS